MRYDGPRLAEVATAAMSIIRPIDFAKKFTHNDSHATAITLGTPQQPRRIAHDNITVDR